MKTRDDPKVRKFFPWSLFLAAAILLMALSTCHGAEPKAKPVSWFCTQVRTYLKTHSEKAGRAYASEHHIADWLVKKAEECLR